MSYKCWRSEDCLFYKWEIMFWANNIFLWKCRTFSFSMSQVEPWHKGLPKVFFYFFIFCGSKTLNFSNSLYFIERKAFSSGVHAFMKREKFTTFFFKPASTRINLLETHHEMFYIIIMECERKKFLSCISWLSCVSFSPCGDVNRCD